MNAAELVLVAALGFGAQLSPQPQSGDTPVTRTKDLRSWEVLDLDCSSEIGRHRMTLFGNGTVRIKDTEGEIEDMHLRELAPEELSGYLQRLRNEDLTESESSARSAAGDWVDSCKLTLELDDGQERTFRFSRFDSLSLALSHIVTIAEEIDAWAAEESIATDFPSDYAPRSGDILRRKDGLLFEVIALTSDKRGVELWGVEQPLVVYVLLEEVVGEFVALVERRRLP
jgi:hypothetical protein